MDPAAIAKPAGLDADLRKAPCADAARLDAVRQLFRDHGASDDDLCVDAYRDTSNLVLTVRGTGPGTIVVGAHYDKVEAGCGAIDNWSGLVLLANLYGAMRTAKPSKTYMFVAFGREESGLVGSKAMAGSIPKRERPLYCAMINLDSFGLARVQVLTNVSSPSLARFVEQVAKDNSIPFAMASAYADADSSPFRGHGIPAVTLHALSNDWPSILHTRYDTVGKINLGSVFQSYFVALRVLERIDACDCGQFR